MSVFVAELDAALDTLETFVGSANDFSLRVLSSTRARLVFGSDTYDELEGYGLSLDENGGVAGFVTKIVEVQDGRKAFTLTDVSYGLADLVSWLDRRDATSFAEFSFAGTDKITGSNLDDRLYMASGDDYALGLLGDDKISGEDGDDHLDGGEGDDYLSGGEGKDVLYGGPGQDELDGGLGDDLIFGGSGDDVSSFAVSSENAGVMVRADGVLVVTSSDGVDTLHSIETLRFTDRDVETGHFEAIDATYQSVGGRAATLSELIVWTDLLAEGRTMSDVRSAIIADALSATAIDTVYQDGFGRAASGEEVAIWRGLFAKGSDLGALRTAIMAEVAPLNATVNALYDEYAGRHANSVELSFWRGQLLGGLSPAAIKAAIVDDAAGGALIDQTYRDFFGRSATTGEIDVWRGLIKGGATIASLHAAILSDAAGRSHASEVIAAKYQDLGGRTPSAGEIATWIDILKEGGTYADLRAAILGDQLGNHAIQVIRDCYQDYFGRAASDSDMATWKGLFARGATTDTLRDTLMTHPDASAGGVATISAGAGRDTIVFNTEHLVINGFNPVTDTIDLRGSALAGHNPIASAREVIDLSGRHDVLIDTADHDLLLTGITLAQLSAGDFWF